ncbi:hypothetical protein BpHYR1_017736 [Brachionus plicatilis]|uniref:Uncharacterized protein n=1 Tax=Brachionus plicatilis TaxID=10195 RepID=A0A3M7S6V5_BRAPC|nr:hypothetical protein BpHYR1_017736 [Brachionus plicatilis]
MPIKFIKNPVVPKAKVGRKAKAKKLFLYKVIISEIQDEILNSNTVEIRLYTCRHKFCLMKKFWTIKKEGYVLQWKLKKYFEDKKSVSGDF